MGPKSGLPLFRINTLVNIRSFHTACFCSCACCWCVYTRTDSSRCFYRSSELIGDVKLCVCACVRPVSAADRGPRFSPVGHTDRGWVCFPASLWCWLLPDPVLHSPSPSSPSTSVWSKKPVNSQTLTLHHYLRTQRRQHLHCHAESAHLQTTLA